MTKVETKLWGNELLFSCLYEPSGSRQPYQLVFSNVHDIRWCVHDTNQLEVSVADFTGFIIGEENHQKPAIVTTDVFEISVLYETLSIQVGSHFRQVVHPSARIE